MVAHAKERKLTTMENRFFSHILGLMKRANLMKKVQGRYIYFDGLAEREAPKFGYKYIRPDFTTLTFGTLIPYAGSKKTIRESSSKDT